jgi:hypothetical protein
MNITAILNRRPSLLVSTTKLTSLVLKNNRQEIEAKSLLLKKREKVSKERIKTFRQLQANVNRKDGTSLVGGGLATAGGLSLLRGKQPTNNIRPFRRPIKPGKLSGLRGIGGRISRGSVITNTLFAGLDFANRKSAGQTNLQAGLGAGGGAVGGIAGAAIGQALIPVPVLGALIGGFIGSSIGSGLADRASGVTGGDFRRRQLEQESIRQLGRTEFTEGLDRFDSALDKFRKYDDDLRGFILRATGNDDKNRAFAPIIPRRGGGATQAQIDAAYAKGVSMGVGGVAVAVLGTVVVVKGGAAILSGSALLKLKGLGAFILKKTKAKALYAKLLKWYKGYQLNKRMMNADLTKIPGVSKKGQLIREGNKILKQIKSEPVKQPRFTKESLRLLDEALKKTQIRIDPSKSGFRKFYKSKRLRDILRRRADDERILREGEALADRIDLLEQIRKVPFDEFADSVIKKSERLKILDFIKKIDKDIINKNLRSDNTIIKEGDNYFASNLGGSTTIVGGEPDPYQASINTIKAYSELTA